MPDFLRHTRIERSISLEPILNHVRKAIEIRGFHHTLSKTRHANFVTAFEVLNAFATPGGYIFVYTGLLLKADNEALLVQAREERAKKLYSI